MRKCVTCNAFTNSRFFAKMRHAGLAPTNSAHAAQTITQLPTTKHRGRRGGWAGGALPKSAESSFFKKIWCEVGEEGRESTFVCAHRGAIPLRFSPPKAPKSSFLRFPLTHIRSNSTRINHGSESSYSPAVEFLRAF